jgi:hypothetical protein
MLLKARVTTHVEACSPGNAAACWRSSSDRLGLFRHLDVYTGLPVVTFWGCQPHSVNAILQSTVTLAWKKEVHTDICTTEEYLRHHAEEQTDHRATVLLEKWFIMVPVFVFCSSSIILHALCNLRAVRMVITYPKRHWKLPVTITLIPAMNSFGDIPSRQL